MAPAHPTLQVCFGRMLWAGAGHHSHSTVRGECATSRVRGTWEHILGLFCFFPLLVFGATALDLGALTSVGGMCTGIRALIVSWHTGHAVVVEPVPRQLWHY